MELGARHVAAGLLLAAAVGAWFSWRGEPEVAAPSARGGPSADPRAGAVALAVPAQAAVAPTLYKWQDDQGVWNYTDSAPADRPFETITGTPNVNSMPSIVPGSPNASMEAEDSETAR